MHTNNYTPKPHQHRSKSLSRNKTETKSSEVETLAKKLADQEKLHQEQLQKLRDEIEENQTQAAFECKICLEVKETFIIFSPCGHGVCSV